MPTDQLDLPIICPFKAAIINCGLPEQWEIDDPRLKYVTIQIDKEDWYLCQKALT